MILNKILMYDADRLHYIITRFLNRDHVLGSLKKYKSLTKKFSTV